MFIILGFEDHIGNEKDAALMKFQYAKKSSSNEKLIRFISNLSLEDIREIRYTHKRKPGNFNDSKLPSLIITTPYKLTS